MSAAGSDAAWAVSGVVALTGLRDGPPLRPPGAAALAARRLMQSFSELSRNLGAGVQLDGARLLGERAALTGGRRAGQMSVGGACRLVAAADGLLAVSLPRPDDPLLAGALIGAEIAGDPSEAIARWAAQRPASAVVEAASELGLAFSSAGERPYRPGAVAAADVVAAAVAGGELPSGRACHATSPVVLDFSALWAGPLCAHLLGLAGARVIKVEARDRPDGARRGNRDFYDLLHGGHQAISVDPRQPQDRALLRDLVDAADIVIEASRPRALAGWGLSAEAAVAAGATWVSITAYGRTGANGQRIGFGDDISAAGGLLAIDPETATTVFCGDAIADPLAGIAAALLALDGHLHGGGRLVDLSMADVAAATLDGTPSATAVPVDGGWELPSGDEPALVREPTARRPQRPAAESGQDTEAVRALLRPSR